MRSNDHTNAPNGAPSYDDLVACRALAEAALVLAELGLEIALDTDAPIGEAFAELVKREHECDMLDAAIAALVNRSSM